MLILNQKMLYRSGHIYRALRLLFALIWLVNGVYCKCMGEVPRHLEIVRRILHLDWLSASLITVMIGIGEVLMGLWILIGWRSRWSTWVQVVLVITMNALEFFLAPDLLLWGRFNALFAAMLVGLLLLAEYKMKPLYEAE